jgi:hypothetical protein
MVTCYIAVAYRPLSYAPSSVSVCNTLFWRKKNRPLGTKFHRKFSIDGPVSTKLMLFFFIGNAQQKHEALIKGCLLFLCMQHLLFNWCWWFYLSVHFMQSSLRTVHYLPVGMDRYIDIFPTKNIDVHPSYSKKKFMPCLSLPEKKVVTLPINLILYKYNIVNIYIMYKILCMK